MVLAGWLAHRSTTAFDSWMFTRFYDWIPNGFAASLLGFSEPALSIAICAAVAIVAAIVRRWNLAALAALAPSLTVLLTEWVFKPMLGRRLGTDQLQAAFGSIPSDDAFTVTGTFPSGHESAVAATACLLVVVGLQLPLSRRVRAVAITAIAMWTLVAAVGLVRNFWHYATDTFGALLLAVVVGLGLALVIDPYGMAVARRLRNLRREPAASGRG